MEENFLNLFEIIIIIYTNKSDFPNSLKTRFHFDVAESIVRSWTIKNLGRKWKDFKGRLWHEFNDSSLIIEEMYERVPDDNPQDQWKTFVNNNNKVKYKVISHSMHTF